MVTSQTANVRRHVPSRFIERRERSNPFRFNFNRETLYLSVQGLFVAFLLLVLVRLGAGAADDDLAHKLSAKAALDGDLGKQISYIAILVGFGCIYMILTPMETLKTVSVFQVFVLVWLLISCTWSVTPDIAFRRAVLLSVVFTCLAIAVNTLGFRRSVQCFYIALAIVVVTSLISVPLFKFAVHPAGESDRSIVGCWRGVMIHKNSAGGVCGMAVILYFHHSLNRGRWFDWLLLVLSFIFLLGTRSKTSLGFLLPILVIGLAYRRLWATPKGRVVFIFGFVTFLALLGLAVATFHVQIQNVLDDPQSFSGRGLIWKTAFMEIADHPFLGAGYSSFWGVGRNSTLSQYVTADYIAFTQHSHNGFIETAVVSGLIGLGLALTASVVVPIKQVFAWNKSDLKMRAMLLSLLLFGIAENLLETQLYAKDREIWIIYCGTVLLMQLYTSSRTDGRDLRGSRTPPLSSQGKPQRARFKDVVHG